MLEHVQVGERADGRRPERKIDRPGIAAPGAVYAALDLGTNNCRMLMATPASSGFRVIDAFSRTTRLGEGLARTGALSEAAIDRTLAALKTCAARMERRSVVRLRSVATEACRRAVNCRSFVSRIETETGIRMEIISAEEEARLALAGCAPLLDRRRSNALVFDIGGGSTELIHVQVPQRPGGEQILALASLPFGVVTLAEERGEALHDPAGYAQTVTRLADQLQKFDADGRVAALVAQRQLQMLGTSGTVTTLAGVHLNLPRYDRAAVDGLVLDFAALGQASRHLVEADAPTRAGHPCIGAERADLVVAGCAILEAICRLWPAGRLTVADRGVREGVLLSMMRDDHPPPPLPPLPPSPDRLPGARR